MESFSENVSPLEADSALREPAETQTSRFLRGSLKSLQVRTVLEDRLIKLYNRSIVNVEKQQAGAQLLSCCCRGQKQDV